MRRVIRTTQSFFVGTPNSTYRFSSRGSHMRELSSHAHAIQDEVTDLAIINQPASHSSLPSLASPPLAITPTRRVRGNSRDMPATSSSTSDAVVSSRTRSLNAESSVQSRIAQLQRNASMSATRALTNPTTRGQPLVLGPSPATAVVTPTLVDLFSQSHPSTVDKSLIDRLESMQKFFDQSLQRALQENASQNRTLQSQRNCERIDAWD